MLVASTRTRFLESPIGRYVRGRTWISAAPCAGLYATIIAGRPSEDELRELGRTYAVRTGATSHVVLFDGSRVETVDAKAHDALLDQFTRGGAKYARHLKRVAVVHGDGLTGALFAGYPKVIRLRCESRAFRDTETALRWLDVAPAVRTEVVTLAESLRAAHPDRIRLAAFLDERIDASLGDAARSLAIAPRTLQRILRHENTTFRDEVDRARWERASRAVRETDEPLTTIALGLGFASLQAFSVWFRTRAGVSPRHFRVGDAGDPGQPS